MKNIFVILVSNLFITVTAYSQSATGVDGISYLDTVLKTQSLKVRFEQLLNDTYDAPFYSLYMFCDFPTDFFERQKNPATAVGIKKNAKRVDAIEQHNDSLYTTEGRNMNEADSIRLNQKAEQVFAEYRNLIRKINSEKDIYMKAVDAEIAKGSMSKYAKSRCTYHFFPSFSSVRYPLSITQLEYLKIFREFVLEGKEELLPCGWRADEYIRRGAIWEYIDNPYENYRRKNMPSTVSSVAAFPKQGSICELCFNKMSKAVALKKRFESMIIRTYDISYADMYVINDFPADFFERQREPTVAAGFLKTLNAKDVDSLEHAAKKAFQEYKTFIHNLKSEKDICLACIDTALAKGSNWPNNFDYSVFPHMATPNIQLYLSQSDFAKVFKELVFNTDDELLPCELRIYKYLIYGTKMQVIDNPAENYKHPVKTTAAIIAADLPSETNHDSTAYLDTIFKTQVLKIKFEQLIEKVCGHFYTDLCILNNFPTDFFERQNESTSTSSKILGGKNLDSLIHKTEQVFQEYESFVRKIKSEKDTYKKYIDAELAKGSSSKYANQFISYHYYPSTNPLKFHIHVAITKYNLLRVFREFILTGDDLTAMWMESISIPSF
jgi:hypothetical protein